jgi:hypothetical protein
VTTPPAVRDRWFRTVTQHGYDLAEGNRYWTVVGSYNPDCLPGFDPLAGNRSLAGYINPPPLLLTTQQDQEPC